MKEIKHTNQNKRSFTICLDESRTVNDQQNWSFIYQIHDAEDHLFEFQLVVLKSFFDSNNSAQKIAENDAVIEIKALLDSMDECGSLVLPGLESMGRGWTINPMVKS